ncbi:MAG: ATP-binding cassette domain-containing protein [Chloroflexota bacterium]
MSMLTLSFISQSFGDYDVFTGISATIPNDGKIGLVGPNGIGKTTLLRIIAGEASPSTGSVHTSKGTRIGYLHQEAMAAFGERTNTVQEEMLLVFAELKAQEARMQELQDAMASGNAPDDIMAQYSRTMDAYEAAGGYEYEVRIDQILQGLGFGRDARDTPLTNLSGGQKTRALLARLLLEQPDILILDEPTNHLDVETIEWLEGMLRLWDGAFLIVSHDRYFLDKVVNRIWEMGPSGMEVYRGNYTHYLTQREERWAQRES